MTISTPLGAQGATLRLAVHDHDLAVEVAGNDSERSFSDGEIVGGDLFWAIDAKMGVIEFSATVDGDTMTGEIKLGDFTDITFVGNYIRRDHEPQEKSIPDGGGRIAFSGRAELNVRQRLTGE